MRRCHSLPQFALTVLLANPIALPLGVIANFPLPAAAQAQTREDRKAEGDRLNKQGIQQYQTSQFGAALQSWQQALDIYQKINDRKGEGEALGNLGIAYHFLGNYAKAIGYHEQSLAIARQINNPKGQGAALGNLGVAYYSLGNYAKAIEYHEQSLTIKREIKDRHGEATSLGNLGNAYQALSNYSKAVEYQQQSLAIAREIKDRLGEGQSLGDLGNAYYSLGNYAKAIEYHEQSLTIKREIRDRIGEGQSLGNLGSAYQTLGNYAKAIEYHEQSLAIAREIKDRLGEGQSLGSLGIAYQFLGNYGKAIEYQQQSLAIAREIKDRPGEGKTLGNLGLAYQSLGNYAKAIEYQQQSLTIAREIKDRQGEGSSLDNLGIAYQSLSNYGKAIEYHEQSLVIKREIKDRQGEGTSLGNLGLGYQSLSNYGKAIEYHEQSLAIAHEIKDRLGEGGSLGDLGSAYQALGNYAKAIEYHEQSLAIKREIKDRRGEATSLGNLGSAYQALGNYAKAINYHEQSLAIAREIKNRLGEGASLGNLGLAYYSLGNYAKAIEYQQKVLAISQEIKDRNSEGLALGNLGIAYAELGNNVNAIMYEQQALAIAHEIGDREGEGIALSNIGVTLAKQKQSGLAIVFYKQSVNVREGIREGIRTLPRDSQEAYTQSVAGTYRSLANLLIEQGRLPEAQAVLELLKLRELGDFTRDAGINSAGISLAKIEETALQQILKRFTTVGNFSQRIAECEQKACSDDIQQLKAQRDQLNAAINQELNQQRSILAKYFATEGSTLTPEKLNAEARRIVNAEPGTVLIYPLILKDKIQFLLALKAGDGAVTFRPFETPNVSAAQLFSTIQTFRNQLKAPGDLKALQATSKQLYDWLIKPLEPELNNPTIKHLVFAPDSTTRYIPLAALFDGQHYLIERYTITTITAASQTNTTDRLPKPISNQPFLLAMGASIFANASPLDNVPAELDAITQTANGKDSQGIYPGTELLNTAFDYAALKQHLPGTRILHIATHGNFVPGRPEDSFLLPGRGENITTTLIDQLGNYGIGDVHLVVLSACETAVGDRASDGIEIPGISYFFLKNNVKAVLASLWSVNDASTSLLMQQFYKNLSTRSKAEALREVQRQFITGKLTAKDAPSRATLIVKGSPQKRQNASSDFTHPFYWAPFILIGNGL